LNDIIIVGAGGHARVVADVIRLAGAYRIRGFLDSQHPERHGERYEGGEILGGEELLAGLREKGVSHAAVAIGDNEARLRVYNALQQHGYEVPALVHPAATVAASVQIGAGSVVFAGTVINSATTIGRAAIINTAASIDHDCVIGDAVHIAPGAHLAGAVTVEHGALVGVGAAVRPGIKIGRNAVVGVGAAVVSDVAAGTTVIGVPARETP
jgi:sugar O-acyltransferase (sialic acid O-acetyltransferase NeuD family)